MKKRWLLIVLLISAVFTSMVEGSSAIYTWSKSFDFQITFGEKDPNVPIEPVDFLKYEMKGVFPDSVVDYDPDKNEIDIQGEAGAYRCFKNDSLPSIKPQYSVHARISNLNPAELKNFGVTFYGSHAANTWQDDTYLAIGYVLKFDQKGDLYIETQKIFHTTGKDKYETIEDKQTHFIMSAADLKKKLGTIRFDRSLFVDIYVRKNAMYEQESYASVYINQILITPTPVEMKKNYLEEQTDGSGKNINIGVSSYQTRDANGQLINDPIRHVKVNELYMKTWDGKLPASK